MKHKSLQRLIFLCVLVMSLSLAIPAAGQTGSIAVVIDSPANGATISGTVTITGSADHALFEAYRLWFALVGTEQWFPISGPVQVPVQDGDLGTWDTNGLPAGQYRLRLEVLLTNGSSEETFVNDLTLSGTTSPDEAATPQPAPTTIPTLAPQNTLQPEPNVETPNTTVEILPDGGSALNALLLGIGITTGAFIIMGLYALTRRRLRQAIYRFLTQLDENTD